MTRVLLVLSLACLPALARAQTTCDANCTVPENQQVEVIADQGVNLAWSYVLSMNGAPVTTPHWFSGSTIVYDFPSGFVAGTYRFRLVAYVGSEPQATWENTLTVQAAPPSSGCWSDGVLLPLGTVKTWTFTTRHGEVGTWIIAREREGWELVSWNKYRGTTTVVMTCAGV